MLRPRFALLSAFALALCACPSPPAADAGADAALDALPDAPLDATLDAPAEASDAAPDGPLADSGPRGPTPYTCMPCLLDRECGPGGVCLEVNPTSLPSLRQCQVACPTLGAPCSAGGVPSTCSMGPDGTPVCALPSSCTPSMLGRACNAGNTCAGRYSVCALAGSVATPVCISPCTRDSQCEDNFSLCRPVVPANGGPPVLACVHDPIVGPERCGFAAVNARGVGAPCGGDAGVGCASGLSCVSGLSPNVPGFCTLACSVDADCGGGARCLGVGAMGNRCVPPDCESLTGAGDTGLDRALTAAGWDRTQLYFTRTYIDVFGNNVTHDRFRLPVFDRVHRDWLAGVRFARGLGPSLDARASALSAMLSAADGLRTTGNAADGPPGAVVAPLEASAPLVEAVARVLEARGGTADRSALAMDAADVPVALQRALSGIVLAALAAADARDRGFLALNDPSDLEHLYAAAPHLVLAGRGDTLDPRQGEDLGALLGDVVLPSREAVALAATIEAVDWSAFRGMLGPSFSAQTPLGMVVVRDGAAHTYEATDYPETLLVVDLGGGDTYRAPVGANASANNPVSVLVDLGGDDTYGYREQRVALDGTQLLPSDGAGRNPTARNNLSLSEVNRQGAGRLGVGLLYDLGAGTDRYRSLRGSQGFGALGIGGLFDDGGDDTYELEAGGQGGAIAGLGVLLDAGGTDTYSVWFGGQGFGYTRGVGVLYDRAGADRYTCQLTPVVYPSAQDMTVNTSMCQGMGFGRRADGLPDHVNMAGGMGVLRDGAGNDQYTASIFGQGSGYWAGMGLLLDQAGDDTYDGRWYVQGGVAHFGYGAVVDGGGRDVHNRAATRQNMTAGAGHDFSLGLFLADGADNDEYNVPNLALGAGNANGAGFFVEGGGDDTYNAASAFTCGNAALEAPIDPGRAMRPTVGFFVDVGGADTYARMGVMGADPVRNDATWSQRIHSDQPNETGAGYDGTGRPAGL